MGATARLFGAEAKMVVRDTAGLVVPLGMPLLILLMNAMNAGTEIVVQDRSVLDVFILPLVTAMVISMVAIINMPSFISAYRKSGILRRLAVTPISPMRVLSVQVAVSVAQALVGMGLAFGMAAVAFGAKTPLNMPGALAVIALALLAMYSVGMLVASVAPTPNSAVAIGLVAFFAFGALGGMFGGTDGLPDWLQRAGELLPFGATSSGLTTAWAGESVPAEIFVGLAVCALVCGLVSALTFRWDR